MLGCSECQGGDGRLRRGGAMQTIQQRALATQRSCTAKVPSVPGRTPPPNPTQIDSSDGPGSGGLMPRNSVRCSLGEARRRCWKGPFLAFHLGTIMDYSTLPSFSGELCTLAKEHGLPHELCETTTENAARIIGNV